MSEVKDPAIKLFGMTISLPPPQNVDVSNSVITPLQHNKNTSGVELTGENREDESTIPIAEGSVEAVTSSVISEDPGADKGTARSSKGIKDDPSESSDSQEKTLKKPDKILPCPRCNSMDTKFCYYNNYNVNQPRHFCKNCQRYWTAGGIMRNVPVGSGRRKNKSSVTNYRHIMVSEVEHLPSLKPNGTTVLAFGSDNRPVEKPQNCVPNEHSIGPSSTSSASIERRSSNAGVTESMWNNFPPCFPGPPWNPSSFPVSFYPPPPYWHCTVPSPWNVPWISSSPQSSSPMLSQTLGKHSRDGNILKSSNQWRNVEGTGMGHGSPEANRGTSVLIPKALRIDDSNEAEAKSSIWSTLGIKNDSPGASLLKAFRSSKADEKNSVGDDDHSWLMKANPAALSRSLNFHEST